MSETWEILQYMHHIEPGYSGPQYFPLEKTDLDTPPLAGADLPLPRGGWVSVLWVDAKHHQIGVERTFAHGLRRERA